MPVENLVGRAEFVVGSYDFLNAHAVWAWLGRVPPVALLQQRELIRLRGYFFGWRISSRSGVSASAHLCISFSVAAAPCCVETRCR